MFSLRRVAGGWYTGVRDYTTSSGMAAMEGHYNSTLHYQNDAISSRARGQADFWVWLINQPQAITVDELSRAMRAIS